MSEYYKDFGGVSLRMKVDTEALQKLLSPGAIEQKCAPVVEKYAFVIEGKTKQDAPVDTGDLKNSIQAEPTGKGVNWVISDGVDYGVFQELGTRFMPGKFFMTNACESTADEYFDAIKDAIV